MLAAVKYRSPGSSSTPSTVDLSNLSFLDKGITQDATTNFGLMDSSSNNISGRGINILQVLLKPMRSLHMAAFNDRTSIYILQKAALDRTLEVIQMDSSFVP